MHTNLNDTPSMGPLTEADADAAISRAWPPRRILIQCASAACAEGRRECPCPQACQRPDTGDDADDFGAVRGFLVALAITAAALAGALLLSGIFSHITT